MNLGQNATPRERPVFVCVCIAYENHTRGKKQQRSEEKTPSDCRVAAQCRVTRIMCGTIHKGGT